MNNTTLLIRTKLRLPYIRPELVPRPRLQEQIERGLRGPLTLITAPAGFGKTTVVASSVASCGKPVAWLSLDKHDNQGTRFLSHLIAALQGVDDRIGREAAYLAGEMQAGSSEAALTSLVNDLDAAAGDLVLALDDYQFIDSPAVHDQVTFLLDHCPPSFHLLIASRSDPPLPLARLRARGQMVELRTADLRFDAAEASRFLNDVMGLELGADAVAVLAARTEGWAAGLQMAALSLRGGDADRVERLIRDFAGTQRFVMDYLLEEVLAREPEGVQAFLLETSILTRITGSLADAVTGVAGGREMLERLARENLFVVPLDDEGRWYRYHQLFADLLQARFRQSGPDRVAQRLLRAAAWCEKEGQLAEAIDYAFAARDFPRAADLVERYWGEATSAGAIDTVWSWLQALPGEIVAQRARLSVACCRVLWLTGQTGELESHLANAERALLETSAAEATLPQADLPAEIATLRSLVARSQGAFEEAAAYAARALRLMPPDLPPREDAQQRMLIVAALASAYDGAGELDHALEAYAETIRLSGLCANAVGIAATYRLAGILRFMGRLQAAKTACRNALDTLQTLGMERQPAAGIVHVAMSEVLVEQNELAVAEVHLAEGLELGKWSGRLDATKNAAPTLSRIRLARHDLDGALAAVQEAEAAAGARSSPLGKAEMLALKARLLVRQGRVSEAAQCVQEARHLAGQDRGLTMELVALAAARVQLGRCEPAEAVAELTHALDATEARGWRGAALELRILRSLAWAGQGDSEAAAADLAQAIAQAEPEGFIRVFLDEGPPLQMLLGQWADHAEAGALRDYAGRLLLHFDAEAQSAKVAHPTAPPETRAVERLEEILFEPLSERELEVLQLIALGKTNKAIARELIVAPGTVKAHTANIYRKLDVANRTEAVARARRLGLLA